VRQQLPLLVQQQLQQEVQRQAVAVALVDLLLEMTNQRERLGDVLNDETT
jgi:hypothetical protein